jgi:hypothetical protein
MRVRVSARGEAAGERDELIIGNGLDWTGGPDERASRGPMRAPRSAVAGTRGARIRARGFARERFAVRCVPSRKEASCT